MPCPSCGGVHSSEQCPESATAAAILSATSEPESLSDQMNPIVAAALRRIKRAHQTRSAPVPRSQSPSTSVGVARAVSGTTKTDAQPSPRAPLAAAAAAKILNKEREPVSGEAPAPQRATNLLVVPSVIRTQPVPDSSPPPKPKRVISDDATDPVLSYLDSILASPTEQVSANQSAPLFLRLTAAVSDLVVVGFLS